MYSRPGS